MTNVESRGWSTAEWSQSAFTFWGLQYRKWRLKVKRTQTLSCLTLTTHCCVMTTCYRDVIYEMCRKWTVLSGRSPRVWRNICSKEIPNLRHGGFGTPRAFPHQLIGCGRVKVDPKQGEGWHIGCLTSGGCGGMVCGKVSHYHGMSDRWDKVWGPLLKPMGCMGLKKVEYGRK